MKKLFGAVVLLSLIAMLLSSSLPATTNEDISVDPEVFNSIMHPKIVIEEKNEISFTQQQYEITRKIIGRITKYDNDFKDYHSDEEKFDIAKTIIEADADQHIGDPLLLAAVIGVESKYRSDSTSSAGAQGMMQLIPSTARKMAKEAGVDSYNPTDYKDSIKVGSTYLAKSIEAWEMAPASRSLPNGRVLTDKEMGVLTYNGGTRVAYRLANLDYLHLVENEYQALLKE